MWGDGTRWCIRKIPHHSTWSHPWVVLYPIPDSTHPVGCYTIEALARELEAAQIRRIDYGMWPGILPGEAGRFPTFELACAAFAASTVERSSP